MWVEQGRWGLTQQIGCKRKQNLPQKQVTEERGKKKLIQKAKANNQVQTKADPGKKSEGKHQQEEEKSMLNTKKASQQKEGEKKKKLKYKNLEEEKTAGS